MHVLSPGGHLPGELALIIGLTETQAGLPRARVAHGHYPGFQGDTGLWSLWGSFSDLFRLWLEFPRSPKVFLESSCSSKLQIRHYLFLDKERNLNLVTKHFLEAKCRTLFQSRGCAAGAERLRGPVVRSQKVGAPHHGRGRGQACLPGAAAPGHSPCAKPVRCAPRCLQEAPSRGWGEGAPPLGFQEP